MSMYHTPFVYIVYKCISDFNFFVQYVEKSFYDLTNPFIYDIIVVSKGEHPNRKGLDYMNKTKRRRFTLCEADSTGEKKFVGWWVVTTATGETWATERYEGDCPEKALFDAIATFGEGATVKAE